MIRIAAVMLALCPLPGWSATHEGGAEAVALPCKAQGYDVVAVNDTGAELAKGAQIDWSVRYARASGSYLLERAVPPGELVHIVAVLGSTYIGGNGRPCEALLQPEMPPG